MSDRPAVAALVLAAGRGLRLAQPVAKAFVGLAGQTLLERSIRSLAASGQFGTIVPVVAREDHATYQRLTERLRDVDALAPAVAGGAERQDSMRAGLASLPARFEWVAVHDAARCLVDPTDVARVVATAIRSGAAILGEPLRDTVKRVVDGTIVETPERSALWAAQTPQVFRRDWLEKAMTHALETGQRATDDAALVEATGRPVAMVEARHPNPKLTKPEDLVVAEVLIGARSPKPGVSQ